MEQASQITASRLAPCSPCKEAQTVEVTPTTIGHNRLSGHVTAVCGNLSLAREASCVPSLLSMRPNVRD